MDGNGFCTGPPRPCADGRRSASPVPAEPDDRTGGALNLFLAAKSDRPCAQLLFGCDPVTWKIGSASVGIAFE